MAAILPFLPLIISAVGNIAVPLIRKVFGSGDLIELREMPNYTKYFNVQLQKMEESGVSKKIINEFKKAKTFNELEEIHNKLKGPDKTRFGLYIDYLENDLEKEINEVVKILKKREKQSNKNRNNIQSIVFSKAEYNVTQSKQWLKDHKYKYGKVDKKPNTLRFRQQDPSLYSKYRIKEISPGIMFVLGFNE